ncbi:BNR repeat-like domain protein [Candidatus Tiddalikarchaeum anstoanum]|nr:BNR repeat-like domain protein [Candidatus Tiddalikarchaeum anstoanum]
MRKTITPIISTTLLILMTIISGAVAFLWITSVQGRLNGQMSTSFSSCSRIQLISMTPDEVVVNNVGCDSVNSITLLIDGVLTSFDLNSPIAPGDTGVVSLTNIVVGRHCIKIVLKNGQTETKCFQINSFSTNFTYTFGITNFAGLSSLNVEYMQPNITYLRLPKNAILDATTLTVETPEIFPVTSGEYSTNMLGIQMTGSDTTLYLLYDTNTTSISDMALTIRNVTSTPFGGSVSNEVVILNATVSTSDGQPDDDLRGGYMNNIVHAVYKGGDGNIQYVNYNTITGQVNTEVVGSHTSGLDLRRLIADKDGYKYLIYKNSTNHFFITSTRTTGSWNMSNSYLISSLPVFTENEPFQFYYDSTNDVFHAAISRKLNETYVDVVYIKSTDHGVTWSTPETILPPYDKDLLKPPINGFYLSGNTNGDILFGYSQLLLGGTASTAYVRKNNVWSSRHDFTDCTGLPLLSFIINNSNIYYFCLKVNGMIEFESSYNLLYKSTDFGSSWSGPFRGMSPLTENYIPAIAFGKYSNNDGSLYGILGELDFDGAISNMFQTIPVAFSFFRKQNPTLTLKVGDQTIFNNSSLSDRSYNLDITSTISSYLTSCGNPCDVPIYIESDYKYPVTLGVTGSYTLPGFETYMFSAEDFKESYYSDSKSQEFFAPVIRNTTILGTALNLEFDAPVIKNYQTTASSRIALNGIQVYGDKNLFTAVHFVDTDNSDETTTFNVIVSKSTDVGETWSSPQTILNSINSTLPHLAMDTTKDYLHGYYNISHYFNYSLINGQVKTQDLTNTFPLTIYGNKSNNDFYTVYLNKVDNKLYAMKNNDLGNSVLMSNHVFDLSQLELMAIPPGLVIVNNNGIHVLIADFPSPYNILHYYYLNSNDGGLTWDDTHPTLQVSISGGGIFPMSFLVNNNDIFFSWNLVGPTTTWGYSRFISNNWSTPIISSNEVMFTASNNGSTIYAGFNKMVGPLPHPTRGFLTKSTDFGQTWSTPVLAFDHFSTSSVASAPKFYFDEPYVYGFYVDYMPLNVLNYFFIRKFVELKTENPVLSIDNNTIWSTSGTALGTYNISGFETEINNYMSTCTDPICDIPFKINSDANAYFTASSIALNSPDTACSIDACNDNNVCTLDYCISGACQFIPKSPSSISGCTGTTGCFNEGKGNYEYVCSCKEGRCRDSCGDGTCQSWENSTNCKEDCVGFFVEHVEFMDDVYVSGAQSGLCVKDVDSDGTVEITAVSYSIDTGRYYVNVYNYTGSTLNLEKQTYVDHAGYGEIFTHSLECVDLYGEGNTELVIAGSLYNSGDYSSFIDVLNVTSNGVTFDNGSVFMLPDKFGTTQSTQILSAKVADLDGANKIYSFAVLGNYYNSPYYLFAFNYSNKILSMENSTHLSSTDVLTFGQSNVLAIGDVDNDLDTELVESVGNTLNVFDYTYTDGFITEASQGFSSSPYLRFTNGINVGDFDTTTPENEIIASYYKVLGSSYDWNDVFGLVGLYNKTGSNLVSMYADSFKIENQNTYTIGAYADDFDSDLTPEIFINSVYGGCPGTLKTSFRLYNVTNHALDLELDKEVGLVNGVYNLANIATLVLAKFGSGDIDNDGKTELVMVSYLTANPCSLLGTYYNSLLIFEYREE